MFSWLMREDAGVRVSERKWRFAFFWGFFFLRLSLKASPPPHSVAVASPDERFKLAQCSVSTCEVGHVHKRTTCFLFFLPFFVRSTQADGGVSLFFLTTPEN